MVSSGPSAPTSRPTSAVTFLLFGPVPRISPMICGSWTRQVKPAAPSGRKPAGRSASSATRCSTPTVSGLPHAGHLSSSAVVCSGSMRTPHLRCPSRWYFPSSGKNSRVPSRPRPVRSASAIAK